jgi:uncharacterized RmlC-like cupin family protein
MNDETCHGGGYNSVPGACAVHEFMSGHLAAAGDSCPLSAILGKIRVNVPARLSSAGGTRDKVCFQLRGDAIMSHGHDHDHAHHHDEGPPAPGTVDWRLNGVRVIKGDQLDTNTAQTPGMNRAAAINKARVGAQKIWAGTVNIHANAKTGAHHHGALESVIYVVRGKARMRWGEKLEFVAEAEPGDFIFVPPYVPHQEINASSDETLECVLVRSDNEAVVVNLDIEPVEKPEAVFWVDPIHKHP